MLHIGYLIILDGKNIKKKSTYTAYTTYRKKKLHN